MNTTVTKDGACPSCGWQLFEVHVPLPEAGQQAARQLKTRDLTPAFTDFDRANDRCKAICPECETAFTLPISLLWP